MLLRSFCALRVLVNHLPVGFVGSSLTELLRHIRVPASERDGQRRVSIRARLVDLYPRRCDQPLHHIQVACFGRR